MATEVKHGPNPKFDHQVTGEPYGLTMVSHYTTTPGVASGGVTTHTYSSSQDGKRLAELLNLRTIFIHWWLTQWVAHRGELQAGETQMADVLRDTVDKMSRGVA